MKRIMAVVVVLLLSVAGCSSDAPSTDTPSTDTPSTDTPSTDTPSTDTPSTEAPATTTPSTEAPATTTPSTSRPSTTTPSTGAPATTRPATTDMTIPSINVPPTIRFVTFAMDGMNIVASVLVEKGGEGEDDIVSVEFAYTKFGIERTVAATKASSTTLTSIWLVVSLTLRVGDTVTIRAVDSRGSTDYTTVTVELTTSMG